MFNAIDKFNVKANIIRDSFYMRKVILLFAISMIPVWLIFGFDSGVGMIEEAIKQIFVSGFNPSLILEAMNGIYGMSFHFSSFVIYGLLFYFLSKQLEKMGITKSRNVIYSGCLVSLNIALFEWIYMASFAHFQMHRQLTEWINTDFWFLQQYLLILFLGLNGTIGVYTESYNGETRVFQFKPNKTMLFVVALTFAAFLFWVHYPFPVETAIINDWTSSNLFPQTHYAYVNSKLYIQNDLLHAVNVAAKALFAISQIYIYRGLKLVDNNGNSI